MWNRRKNAKAHISQAPLSCKRSAPIFHSQLHLHFDCCIASAIYTIYQTSPSSLSILPPASPSLYILIATPTPSTNMSDDEDYYDFEEEYLYEDAVPDLVVSKTRFLRHETHQYILDFLPCEDDQRLTIFFSLCRTNSPHLPGTKRLCTKIQALKSKTTSVTGTTTQMTTTMTTRP